MKVEEAIKKAIEGGYKKDNLRVYRGGALMDRSGHVMCSEEIWCDPFFWQSLGKALGLCKGMTPDCCIDNYEMTSREMEYWETRAEWKYVWHRFIDDLADGKTAEEFFEGLN